MTGDRKVITGRYYNCNGYACAIVAVITKGIDWSAYIGGTNAEFSEADATEWVARHGAKLFKMDALHFFPKDLFPEVDLPYRS